jgi:signal transduction histidine kinase
VLLSEFYASLEEVAPRAAATPASAILGRAAADELHNVQLHVGEVAPHLFAHIEEAESVSLAGVEHSLGLARTGLTRVRQMLHGTKSAAWAAEASRQFTRLSNAISNAIASRRVLKDEIAAFIAQRKVMDDLLDDKIQTMSDRIFETAKDEASFQLRAVFVSLALAALMALLGATMIVRQLSRALVAPLQSLAAGAARLEAGPDEPVELEIQSGDELGELTRSFNEAAAAVWRSRQELSASNVKLEREVSARTKDLSAALAALEGELAARRVVERELEAAVDDAQAANRAKSALLANMSHELRTPLNAIIGFSELIAEERFGPDARDKYRDYARDVHSSGLHLLALINDLLDMAKIESGQFELYLEPTDPMDIVGPCRRLLLPQAEAAGVTLELKPVPREPAIVHADQKRLRQILLNLLSNAVKFTPQGGAVSIGVTCEGESVDISVVDTGIGMSPEEVESALLPFKQIDSKLSRKHEGTGLGLPIAKRLTELSGGALFVDSAPGRGTTVCVRLPKSAAKDVTMRTALARNVVALTRTG